MSDRHQALVVPKRLWPLLALNFFMADFQAGIGPFLGVFLHAHGWLDGMIGTVMTAGGIAGMRRGILPMLRDAVSWQRLHRRSSRA